MLLNWRPWCSNSSHHQLISHQQQRNCYISDHLNNCHFVIVHHDVIKKPLQPPYDGPFQVLQCHNKHFTLDINGHEKVVSLDHLKPAFVKRIATATVTDTPASQSQTPTAAISPPNTDLPQWSSPDCSLEGEYCSNNEAISCYLHRYNKQLNSCIPHVYHLFSSVIV